jgi:hypothetical protein
MLCSAKRQRVAAAVVPELLGNPRLLHQETLALLARLHNPA